LDTSSAYQNDPVTFNEYVARDAVISIGGAHKYLPKHTPMLFTDKTPVEIRYFPSATSQDFIFNDSIPAGLSFYGAISITKHTSKRCSILLILPERHNVLHQLGPMCDALFKHDPWWLV